MRVVMVSKALIVGSYQRKLEELARLDDIELTVIVPSGWREGRAITPLHRAHTAGYRLIEAPLAFNGQYHLHFYPTLGRLLRSLRPDVLHMDEEPYNLATWLALRQGRTIGSRSLFFTWQNLIRRYPWPFRGFEIANYRMAAYAIAGNPTAETVLRAKGYTGKLAIIPQFGVDPDLFEPAAAQVPPAAPVAAGRPFVIGYAGRLVPEKGVDVLLRACALLPQSNWTLHLLGKGPAQEHLAALAGQLGMTDRVFFLGHRPSTQTAEIYRTFDVLVLPSVSLPNWVEQFGRVLIEAMACGVPVVGSVSGEIPWVIGDAGVIFPEGDADALSRALAGLAGDASRRAELARAGRQRVLAHFTQAHIASATAQVYRAMIA